MTEKINTHSRASGQVKPGYKKTSIGIIPEDWEVKKLGDFLDKIVGGGTPSRSNESYWNGEIPWVTVKDFATFNPLRTQEYITEKGLKNSASNLIPAKTLITATRMGLGKVSIYEVDVAINQDLKAIFPKKNLNRDFLFHWFNKNEKYIESLGNGSTVKGITLDDLKSLKFYEIPIEEQKSIAACLSTWDNGIEKLSTLIEAKKQQKKGLMQQLFNGQMKIENGQLIRVENEEDWLKGWKEVKLGKYFIESKIKSKYNNKDKRISVRLHLEGLDKREIRGTEADSTQFYVRKAGQFIYGKQNFHNGSLGIIPEKYHNYETTSDIPSFDINEKINHSFIFFLISRKDFYERMENSTTGTGSKRLHPTEFLNTKVKIPTLEEQTAIAEVLSTADKEIELLEQKLEAMKIQKKGLMQVLLTGEKRLV